MSKTLNFIKLARLDKPIGIYLLLWPSILGLLVAGINNELTLKSFIIVVLGSIIVRSCGCVINDICDYEFDKFVERTKNRPLASGALTLKEAWAFFVFLSIFSLVLLIFTPIITIKISLIVAIFIVLYPLTKRFFKAPQLVLGLTFGSGSVIAYSLVSNDFLPSIFILYFGIISWIVSFDTFYALADKEDDEKIGIYSTPLLFGNKTIQFAKVLHLFFYFSLGLIGYINNFSLFFIITILVLIIMYFIQMNYLKKNEYLNIFKFNNLIGFVAVVGFYVEIILL